MGSLMARVQPNKYGVALHGQDGDGDQEHDGSQNCSHNVRSSAIVLTAGILGHHAILIVHSISNQGFLWIIIIRVASVLVRLVRGWLADIHF
jgi:hypothetical protein